jgi:galactose mutarotase-like enzyme
MTSRKIKSPALTAIINGHGAELCSLRDARGREYLWQAGDSWKRHAPNLFPIVGRLRNDMFRHKGRDYKMTQHGFARDRIFAWEAADDTSCRLSLRDDAQTREAYPFSFRFDVEYAISGAALSIACIIENTGDEILPASVGAHPAFNWPLAPGIGKAAHRLEFSHEENGALRQVQGGLLRAERAASPVKGRMLELHENLFAEDALIFDAPASRSVIYGAPGAAAMRVSWDDGFRELGIWAKPGADFICIEPWRGMASPEDFNGEIMEKPGMMLISPGEIRKACYKIEILA